MTKQDLKLSICLAIYGMLIGVLLNSCTLSVTTIHTQGTASDVVDETQRADPTVSPNLNLSVPASAL